MRKPWLMAALLCGCGTLAAQKPFTLEQVLANPFPEHLVAAPAGGRVAWQMNVRGARNIWVAAPPDYRGRQITSFTQDDGQDIGELSWTPDGRSIVFVHGGDFDMRREAPNARSNPEGVEQAVWVIAADGGAPRKLGEGQSPAISPKGDQVAFLFKDQIWRAPLDGHEKAEQAVHSRGTAGALRWSPDGSKLAFVSGRGNHSFIGVFDPAGKTVRYLDPSVDHDSEPAWSPDSREIAFLRIPSSADSFAFGPKMTADEPWSIRAAEVASGHGRQIWRAEPGRGSAFQGVVAQKQLLWANGRVVFPWERTGWVHLYSVPAQGGSTAELTPGEFEVEHVTESPNGRELVFSSNHGDTDRRHLWKVAVDHAPPAPLTSGEGIEWAPVVTSDREAIAFLHSDAQRPPRPAIIVGAGAAKDLAPDALPADFPSGQLVKPEAVMISAADGLRIHGQLFLPHNLRAGERKPAVIFFHGGSRRQMLLGWHYMYYYSNA
jgi:Tol biopolymer transport system component